MCIYQENIFNEIEENQAENVEIMANTEMSDSRKLSSQKITTNKIKKAINSYEEKKRF